MQRSVRDTTLGRLGWSNPKTINRVEKFSRVTKDYPDVVIIDDFSGSGTTLKNRIQYLKDTYRGLSDKRKNGNFNVRVSVLAATNMAKTKIEELGVPIHVQVPLDRGISDRYLGSEFRRACRCMVKLESLFDQKAGKDKFPSFGWGKAEALFAVEDCDVPNSVFPLFWWPKLWDGSMLQTLLCRTGVLS